MHTTKSAVWYSLEQEDEGQSREDRPGTPIYKVAAVAEKEKKSNQKIIASAMMMMFTYRIWYEDTQNDGE